MSDRINWNFTYIRWKFSLCSNIFIYILFVFKILNNNCFPMKSQIMRFYPASGLGSRGYVNVIWNERVYTFIHKRIARCRRYWTTICKMKRLHVTPKKKHGIFNSASAHLLLQTTKFVTIFCQMAQYWSGRKLSVCLLLYRFFPIGNGKDISY